MLRVIAKRRTALGRVAVPQDIGRLMPCTASDPTACRECERGSFFPDDFFKAPTASSGCRHCGFAKIFRWATPSASAHGPWHSPSACSETPTQKKTRALAERAYSRAVEGVGRRGERGEQDVTWLCAAWDSFLRCMGQTVHDPAYKVGHPRRYHRTPLASPNRRWHHRLQSHFRQHAAIHRPSLTICL